MLKGATETLDSRQTTLFKSLVKLYETKQYKKGLRQAEILLEQKPGHAETMSMKAIFMYFTGEKVEALELSKKALYKNMKSDIAWHIYGIIHRSNRNYQEAINCYKKALDYAPENVQILRDLALLQAQIRDVEGLCETRRKLLLNKDSLIINWVAYAFSLHLKGAADESLKVIQSIQNIQKNNPLKGVEKSEFTLYHAQVYGDSGDLEAQLKTLETNEADILDKSALSEMKANVLLKLGKPEAAVLEAEKLIERNPYNKNWYNLLKITRGLPAVPTTEEERLATSSFFDEISLKYKVNIVQYMGLEFAAGEDFEKKLIAYITPYFRKAIPSLFSELKHLYAASWRVAIIEKILLAQAASLEKDGKFIGSDKEENPTCLLWAYMLLAQHFDKIGQLATAVEYVNKAIAHTPTLIELYLVKAKILKHQFNHTEAFELTEKARKMDLADRYLNNKAIKYALRCGQDDLANELLRLFLKDPTEGNPFELQSLWFEIAQGEILLKRGEYSKALRMFKFVHRAFIDVYEDQFDFHTYCIRRYNLITYSRLINYESNVYNQKPFIYGATLLLRSLLEYVPIQQKEIKDKEDEVLRIKNMSQMEKKKYKKQQELEAANAAKDPLGDFRKKHDLEGEEFRNSKPLVEANLVAKTLVHTTTPCSQLAYQSAVALLDFYIETNRPMLVIKALNRGVSSNWCANGIHLLRVKAAIYLEKYLKGEKLNETIKKYAEEALAQILQGKSVEEFNSTYHSNNGASAPIYKNSLAKLKSDIALGKTPSSELLVLLKETLLTHTDLPLADAARLYDEFLKLNGFQEDENVSTKLQKQYPSSEYYFTLQRFSKREDGAFQSPAPTSDAKKQ